MKIAVTGSTGRIGGQVVRRLANNGEHQVVGLTRHVAPYDDVAALRTALTGVDTSADLMAIRSHLARPAELSQNGDVDDRTRALLDDAVSEHVAKDGQVVPPWIFDPGLERFSLGWRMGGGEWHLMVWQHWWQSAERDEAARIAYFRAHRPPTEWLDWAAAAVWPDLDRDSSGDGHDAAVRRLAELGIGSYAAWYAWMSEDDLPTEP